MKTLWLLTKKNLKLLVRSKTSALVVFFAPLFIILLLGLSYNTTSNYGLNIGIHAPSFTSDVESLMSSLQEQEFKIVKYETSIEDCVKDIKGGYVHTCVSLPESFAVESNEQKEVLFYVDPSKINLVWVVQEVLGEKFNLKSQEISKELSGGLLSAVSDTKSKLEEQRTQLSLAKEKSAAASSVAQEINQQLTSLDLTVPTSSYDSQLIVAFKDTASPKIKSSLSDVKDAIETVEASELADKSAILSSLSEVEDKLKSLNTLVSGGAVSSSGNASNQTNVTNVTSTASSGFLSALVLLEEELLNTKVKLTAAATAVGSTSSSLSSTTQNLQESVSALESAEQRVHEMKASLDAPKVTDANVLSAPLVTKIEKVGQESSYLNYMFPALLVLVVMFTSLLLGTTLVMMEKNSPAFFRNYFLPLRKGTFVMSTYLTTLVITLVQVLVILAVSAVFLKGNLVPLLPVAGVLLLSSSVFSFMGMGIGYAFKSEETGALASISTGSLLLFVSGIVLPIETISPAVRSITSFNPFVISESVIREVFLFNAGLSGIWSELVTLAGYTVGLFTVIVIAEYLVHQHFISGFMKSRHLKHRQQEKRDKNNV